MENPLKNITPIKEPLAVGSLFAVYGTLRQGSYNHQALNLDERAEFVRTDYVKGTLYHLGGFPGLLPEASDTLVEVEVFKLVDYSLAASLDRLEGYRPGRPGNSMYVRAEVKLENSGETAEIYYYNNQPPKERIITSGNWNNRGTL